MICGVDSYLTALTIAHYLAERRLLTPDNPNGFIPGEAAAAILCARPGTGGAAPPHRPRPRPRARLHLQPRPTSRSAATA